MDTMVLVAGAGPTGMTLALELARRGVGCRVIEKAVWLKEEGHLINQEGFVRPSKSMSQIGG